MHIFIKTSSCKTTILTHSPLTHTWHDLQKSVIFVSLYIRRLLFVSFLLLFAVARQLIVIYAFDDVLFGTKLNRNQSLFG